MSKSKSSQAARKARSNLRAARFQARLNQRIVKFVDSTVFQPEKSLSPQLTTEIPRDLIPTLDADKREDKPRNEAIVEEDDVLIITEDLSDFD